MKLLLFVTVGVGLLPVVSAAQLLGQTRRKQIHDFLISNGLVTNPGTMTFDAVDVDHLKKQVKEAMLLMKQEQEYQQQSASDGGGKKDKVVLLSTVAEQEQELTKYEGDPMYYLAFLMNDDDDDEAMP